MRLRFLLTAALTAACFLACAAGPALAAGQNTKAHQQVLIRFKAHTPQAQIRAALHRAGIVQVGRVRKLNVIVGRATGSRQAAVHELDRSPAVSYAEQDGLAHATLTPNDPHFNDLSWVFSLPHVSGAWDASTGSSSVIVAVLDTGVNAAHEDLTGSILTGYNAFDGSANTADDNGHGTETSGTIAAHINNSLGTAGICAGCQILPVKVLDSSGTGSWSTIANGITWATDHGATIINMSLAGYGYDSTLDSAVQYAISHGVLVVAAAGNDSTIQQAYPAADSGVVSVAASDYNDHLYSFSNHGSWVDVAAPGCVETTTMSGSYNAVCGTSFASPFTAGVAALMKSYNPALTAAQLKQMIEQSANKTLSLDVANGRVDALAALEAAGWAAPTNTAVPTLSGSARVGNVLTSSAGTWTNTPSSYSYTFQRCDALGANCTDVQNGSSATYTLVSADYGKKIKVQVAASNSAGTSTAATSAASGQVMADPPFLTGTVTLSGLAKDGQVLSTPVSTSSFTGAQPITVTYLWERCNTSGLTCSYITGATAASYTLTSADVGSTIKVRVDARNVAGTMSGESPASAVVAAAPAAITGAPTISGTAQTGQTLTANQAAAAGTTPLTVSLSWKRCDSAGANCAAVGSGATYTLVSADLGSTIKVVETASNTAGSDSATSGLTAVVQDPPPPPAPAPPSSPSSGGGGGGLYPDIRVELTLDQTPAAVGDQVVYRARVYANPAAGPSEHVVAVFTVPAGVQIVSNQVDRGPGCSQSGQTLTCDVGWITPGVDSNVILIGKTASTGVQTLGVHVDASEEQTSTMADNDATVSFRLGADPSTGSGSPSNPAPKTPPAATTPTVSGAIKVGRILTVKVKLPAFASPGRTTVVYQWQACRGSRCLTVKQTSAPRLVVPVSAAGAQLRVRVVVRHGKQTKTVVSAKTRPVVR